MNLDIKTLSSFEKDVKRLFKKYKQLPSDLKVLKEELSQNPKSGIELGNGCYKIRLANNSIPTGKSGGFRVIYYYIDKDNNLYLMSMYSKNELENIDDKIIINILKANNLL
ncbi:type II toxin-antitoxin system RelE/ParE family toxin [bacterium]|nr:type II toxin-antitoxin system RelE/ParE family toxin [bacterium]MBU1994205.1 type II toxin-antitoxin system RelE/ParE family toxin [bacterium]